MKGNGYVPESRKLVQILKKTSSGNASSLKRLIAEKVPIPHREQHEERMQEVMCPQNLPYF